MAFDQKQQPGTAVPDDAQAAPGAEQPSDDDGDEAPAGSIVITPSAHGFMVDLGDGPQPAASAQEVLQMVEQALGGSEDPAAMWAQEAQKRQPGAAPGGVPQQGMGGQGPRMTM